MFTVGFWFDSVFGLVGLSLSYLSLAIYLFYFVALGLTLIFVCWSGVSLEFWVWDFGAFELAVIVLFFVLEVLVLFYLVL